MERFKLFVPLIIFLIMSVFLYRGLSIDPSELPSVVVDKPFPEFSLPQLGDETEVPLARSDIVGEPFLLNVWASWCPTCLVEHPYLVKLSKQGVKIVGLNWKDEDDKAKQWIARYGNPYSTNLVDYNGRLVLDLGVSAAPETFVVDASGTIRYRHVGEVTEKVWRSHMAPIFNESVN